MSLYGQERCHHNHMVKLSWRNKHSSNSWFRVDSLPLWQLWVPCSWAAWKPEGSCQDWKFGHSWGQGEETTLPFGLTTQCWTSLPSGMVRSKWKRGNREFWVRGVKGDAVQRYCTRISRRRVRIFFASVKEAQAPEKFDGPVRLEKRHLESPIWCGSRY